MPDLYYYEEKPCAFYEYNIEELNIEFEELDINYTFTYKQYPDKNVTIYRVKRKN